MQLLLRSPARVRDAATDGTASVEVAASPDSPARERWLWDVRLESSAAPMTDAMDAVSLEVSGAGRGIHFVNARFDASVITAEIRVEILTAPADLRRPEGEIWVAIIEAGELHDGSFTVRAGDVLVWEGDDPLSVALRPTGHDPVQLAVVKLGRRDGKVLRWVP
ncbi:MAG: hypothetical protein F2793_04530 [Actinobacteria bacterium]|nr:hypothetical protein [Actinomycetota bacterium]